MADGAFAPALPGAGEEGGVRPVAAVRLPQGCDQVRPVVQAAVERKQPPAADWDDAGIAGVLRREAR